MNRPRRVCAVSGSRADYGLLTMPLRALRADPDIALSIVLTGQHLVRSAGDTAARVRADGFDVAAEIDMKLEGDDAVAVIKAAGRALDGMADVLVRLAPDLLLLVGDRYEILCAAFAATIARIPIAHIAGGDVTEGAFDDAFRHSITKMAHLHFVTSEDAARRVRQLGEPAERIHVVGSPGLDLVGATKLPSREEFFASIDFVPRPANILCVFHPVTLASDSIVQLEELLATLRSFGDKAAILFTGSNADPEARRLEHMMRSFADAHKATYVPSLGAERYFAALAYMDVMVGNSSSGLYEAPSFGIPTVNVGDRQKGRLRAESVFDCPPRRDAIRTAIDAALARGRRPTVNPYGDGHSAERIVRVINGIAEPKALLNKQFVALVAA